MRTHTSITQTRVGGKGRVAALALTALACAGLAPAASAGVQKYDSKLTITGQGNPERPGRTTFRGKVISPFRNCEGGRQVVLFKQRPGADRRLGKNRTSEQEGERGKWRIGAEASGGVYAKVRRDHDRNPSGNGGYVCRADRAPNDGTTQSASKPRPDPERQHGAFL